MPLQAIGAIAATVPFIGMAKYTISRNNSLLHDKTGLSRKANIMSEKSDISLYSPECTSVPFMSGDYIEDLAGQYAENPNLLKMQASQIIYGMIAGEAGVHAYANGHTSKAEANDNWGGWDFCKAEGRLHPISFMALEATELRKSSPKHQSSDDYAKVLKEAYDENPLAGFTSNFINWASTGQPTKSDNVMAAARAMIAAMLFSDGFQGSPRLVTRQALRIASADGSNRDAIKGGAVAAGAAWLAATGADKGAIYKYAQQYYDIEDAVIHMDEAPQSSAYAVPYAIKKFCNQKCLEDTIYEIASEGGAAYAGAGAIAGGLACTFHGLTKEDRNWVRGFVPEKYLYLLA